MAGIVSILGSVEVTGSVTVSGTVSISGTVEVTGSVTVSGTVAISGTVTVEGSVTVSGTVGISGTVTITGDVTVSGTVTISGAVTITSGTVNIQTAGQTNIVIDLLKQEAYLDLRRTLTNPGSFESRAGITGNIREGKVFPWGARGFLYTVEVDCRNVDTAAHTITVYVAPYIGAGPVYSANITVPASSGDAWRAATVNKMWNYVSLFIFVVADDPNVQIIRGTGTDPDAYHSTDAGATWTDQDYQWWFRAIMKGQEVGVLPVGGTLNVVEVPSVATRAVSSATAVPHNTQTKLLEVVGSGTLLEAIIEFTTTVDPDLAKVYAMYIYADGNLAKLFSNQQATQSQIATFGRCCCGEFYKMTTAFDLFLRMPIKFRRNLKLYALQTSGAQINCTGWLTTNIIK